MSVKELIPGNIYSFDPSKGTIDFLYLESTKILSFTVNREEKKENFLFIRMIKKAFFSLYSFLVFGRIYVIIGYTHTTANFSFKLEEVLDLLVQKN